LLRNRLPGQRSIRFSIRNFLPSCVRLSTKS
jgi:hypothetical protein